jgi:D-glycero-D-manno-heptose 1,7-bisphosphate phosphatase
MPLLILDRDGVINQDSDRYIRSLDDWQPIPGSLNAIARLSQAGYDIAVATNQSGLGRGYFSTEQLAAIHARLHQEVEDRGGKIAGIFYCPHLPEDGCQCRKPATGLLSAIETELGQSPRGAPFVGDSLKDLQAARQYGCLPILVRTGKGEKTLASLRSGHADLDGADSVPVYPHLAAVATALLIDRAPKSDGS